MKITWASRRWLWALPLALTLIASTVAVDAATDSHDATVRFYASRLVTAKEAVPVRAIDSGYEIADDDASDCAEDLMGCAFSKVFELYLDHFSEVNHGIFAAWQHWHAAKQENAQMSTAVQNLLLTTPALRVELGSSPCAGPQTVHVVYHIDGSQDCVNPLGSHSIKLSEADLLFIDTVDARGNPNNAMVYQYVDAAKTAKFLGTVTAIDHSGFKIDYTDGHVIVSFDNAHQTRTNCLVGWANGKYRQICQ